MQAIDIAAVTMTFGNDLHFDTQPCLFRTLYKWLEHVPDAYSNAQQQARLSLRCWCTSPKCTSILTCFTTCCAGAELYSNFCMHQFHYCLKEETFWMCCLFFNPLKCSDVRQLQIKSVQCHPGLTYIVISDIRALWHSGLSARVPECQKLKM